MNNKILILFVTVIVTTLCVSGVFAISSEETHANNILNKDNNNGNVLVVYFSRTGENYSVLRK